MFRVIPNDLKKAKTKTSEIADLLVSGKIGVLPTDTIYGIHCDALNFEAITKVYELKERPENMPFITLISNFSDLIRFKVLLNDFSLTQINKLWPGPNTLIFETEELGSKSFRLPNNKFLLEILNLTGPLISTSANTHGNRSAKSAEDAMKYFGSKVDFYVDRGVLDNPPSSIYKILSNKIEKIR